MPIYEYVCDSCGYGFERIQSFSDDPLSECPRCGAEVRRVISPVGIIFKGSGWYITDSRRQIGSNTSSRGRRQLSSDMGADTGGDSSGADSGGQSSESAADGGARSRESAGGDSSAKTGGESKASSGTSGKKSDGGSKS